MQEKLIMIKIFFVVCFLAIFTPSLYATELEILNGRKRDIRNTVDSSVVDLKLGPEMPVEIFNALDDVIKKKYVSAQYRLVFTTAEIFYILSIDLLAIWEEGDRVVIDSYVLPLVGYINIKFIKWHSYNNFDLILESFKKERFVNITIMPGGKFVMKFEK